MKKIFLMLVSLAVLCFSSACVNNGPNNDDCNHEIGYDGNCLVCGEYVPSNGVVYNVSLDGKAAVVCDYNGDDEIVVIANTYKNLPVTTVAEGAFQDCDFVRCLVFGDNILSINSGAVSSCYNLNTVVLGEKVAEISTYAFSRCYKIVEVYNKSQLTITVGDVLNGNVGLYAKKIYTESYESNLSITDDGYVIYADGKVRELISYVGENKNLVLPNGVTRINDYAFLDNDKIESIDIVDSVTEIGDSAFATCDILTTVRVGDGVSTIGESCFTNSINLKSITIGKNLESIGWQALENCNFISIAVDAHNQSYKSINGSLYSFDGKKLLQYAIGKNDASFTIPNGVTSIARGAFRHSQNLTNVIISDSVLGVDDWAFADCTKLSSVYVGKNVNYISNVAFSNTRLINITVDERNSDFMSEGGNLYMLTNGVRNLWLYSARSDAHTFVVPNDVTFIANNAFYGCDNLVAIEIGDGVTTIGEYAIIDCEKLETLIIGRNVSNIRENAFYQCDNLSNIIVDNNENFKIEDKNLYTSDGELIYSIKK